MADVGSKIRNAWSEGRKTDSMWDECEEVKIGGGHEKVEGSVGADIIVYGVCTRVFIRLWVFR